MFEEPSETSLPPGNKGPLLDLLPLEPLGITSEALRPDYMLFLFPSDAKARCNRSARQRTLLN